MADTSNELVLQILRDHGAIGKDEEIISFESERIVDGKGVISALFRYRVNGHSYVGKMTLPDELVDEAGGGDTNELCMAMHNHEMMAYEWMEKQRKSANYPDDFAYLSLYFGGERIVWREKISAGLILLEDLGPRLYSGVRYELGYDARLIEQIIHAIVGYQCAYLRNPDTLNLPSRDVIAIMDGKNAVKAIDLLPEKPWLTECRRRELLSWCCLDVYDSICSQYEEEESDLPLVFSHIDLWAGNLMFEKTGNAPNGKLLKLIDWQFAGYGVALLDLATPIAMCLRPEVRRQNTERQLQLYVNLMVARSGEFKRPFPMTIEKARSIFARCLRYAILHMIITMMYRGQDDVLLEDDVVAEGEEAEGATTRRLRAILEDVLPL